MNAIAIDAANNIARLGAGCLLGDVAVVLFERKLALPAGSCRPVGVAGLALGCLAFKPQLGLAAAVVFIITGSWRIVAGGALAAAGQLAAGVFYYGGGPFLSWLRTLWHVPALLSEFEPRWYQTHCLRTFWSMLVPWRAVSSGLYAISAVAVLACTIAIWKRSISCPLKYSALLLATVLISPHLTVYDLVILAPAILLLADWRLSHPMAPGGIGVLLYLVFVLPLLGPYTRWIPVQLSVIAMAALLYWIWRITSKQYAVSIAVRTEARTTS